ncbi:MAG: GNAT family N-acetyltransferase [Brevinema sp.]
MIRKMIPQDIPIVSKLLYHMYIGMCEDIDFSSAMGDFSQFQNRFIGLSSLPKHHHFVYNQNNQIIAYYLLAEEHFPSKKLFDCEYMCYLGLLVVDPSHQNKGIGSLLIQNAKQETLKLGYQELNLEVLDSSEKNIKLYTKHNFIKFTQHLICDLSEETTDNHRNINKKTI